MVFKLVTAFVVPLATIVLAATPGPYHPQPTPYAPHAPPPHHPEPVYPDPHHAPPHHPAPHAPQGYCDPKAPPKCAHQSDLPFCLEDPEYPDYEIANKISQDPIFLKKYSDVPDQSADDLVEHITKYQEDAFDYAYYTGASKGPSPFDLSHWAGPEGYLCPSQVDYAKIKRAVNVEGYWRIILQHVPKEYGYGHYNYTQTTRLETCLTPDSACRLLAPCYNSKCTQKYVYHRMVSVDPCDPYRGFFIDTYKLPSACSCHVPQ
ncbi:hypothetical protein TCAL_09397 [Tigriopus californicus]|uniref:Spaetzle domain-containing protein n=1 Tax=Tigriopus californicus TaxID=6832 RepID=A0A553NVY0_TIGCA|nr:uncharacterized protein LOC131888082 [Tigriopus californicus]TRY69595.1 hypothetical protein TCAL_09397 [Tigriopus californicus]|eukprot:TCALIF_09397-PA protein Name:"Protein of unknown function" AED:0.08 eAED:0.08 QI:110/1/1/1/0/0.5/2/500/261